ncbi:MAG: sensor histidine kinase [Rhodobacteraceae bacterium]|nr:sensor histidine kinase [Paracoccaceae bacterium]
MTHADTPDAAWYRSIRVRLIAFMTLALLPVGLIAVWQTASVTEKSRQNAELALRVLTEQAAQEERLIIQRAFGAAQALEFALNDIGMLTPECSAFLRGFVERSPRYSFAGFLPLDGRMTCSSSGRSFDFSGFPGFEDAIRNPGPRVEANHDAPISARSVVVVSQPWFDDRNGALTGYLSISIPHDTLRRSIEAGGSGRLVDLIAFNGAGDVLTSLGDVAAARANLPVDTGLATLVDKAGQAFSGTDTQGNPRVFALAPVQPGRFYVLGVWDAEVGLARQLRPGIATSLFPAVMWLVSLCVALLSIHLLVARHIATLGSQMVAFARNRAMPSDCFGRDAPTEIRRIHELFQQMTAAILHDEAQLEDSVREKNVLLREVHHRVKNNLQLISSIINMQIRQVRAAEAKHALRRIQERVVSLATIHRDLYQSNAGGRVNVGQLLREVINNTVEMAATDRTDVQIHAEIEDIWLYPDQAVPMSLLAAEAATNAMKHVGNHPDDQPWIRVRFTEGRERERLFALSNSIGEGPANSALESTGMGSKLIGAFAIQLGAQIETGTSAGAYHLTVRFEAQEFAHETVDY